MKRKKQLRAVLTTVLAALLVSASLSACGGEPPPPTPTPTPAATPTPSASEHLDRGIEYYDQGQFEQAIAEFEEAIRLDPEMAEAHTNLGVVYDAQGRYEEAVAEYQQAIQLEPDNELAHFNLALSYYDQGLLDQAIAEYEETIRINPDHADAHYNLGRAYYEQGRLDEAIVQWKKTAELEPTDSMTHNNLGRVYFEQGRLDEAIAELNQAIELDAENALAYFNLGLVYRQQNRIDDAIAAFETYLELIPPDHPNREMVEQEIASLKEATGESVPYRNTAGGYSLLYPANLQYDAEDAWTVFAGSETAVDAAFDNATAEAIAEGPLVMFDAQAAAEFVEDFDVAESDDPVAFLQALAEGLDAEIANTETGNIGGYPAAIAGISGAMGGTDYRGGLAIVLVEDRVIGANAMSLPDQWDAFAPTFADMILSLTFFAPEE